MQLLRTPAVGILLSAVLAQAALAAGEPKNELPFTRSVASRTPQATAHAAQVPSPVIQGEPKTSGRSRGRSYSPRRSSCNRAAVSAGPTPRSASSPALASRSSPRPQSVWSVDHTAACRGQLSKEVPRSRAGLGRGGAARPLLPDNRSGEGGRDTDWKMATPAAATTTALLASLGTSTAPAGPRRVSRGGALVAKIPVSTPRDVTAGFGSIWVANGPSSTITRIDPATDKITAVIAVPNPASVLAVGAGAAWVTSFPGRSPRQLPLPDPAGVGVSCGKARFALYFAGHLQRDSRSGATSGYVCDTNVRS
jgi:hypothetical protein